MSSVTSSFNFAITEPHHVLAEVNRLLTPFLLDGDEGTLCVRLKNYSTMPAHMQRFIAENNIAAFTGREVEFGDA